jgi:hypothetical protein
MGNNGAATMNWDGYEIYDPGAFGPLHALPRTEARRAFNKLMDAKPGRIQMLHWLLNANGAELAGTSAGIQDLNDWFVANVQADPGKPGRLLPAWYSVVNDAALFLGDVMIQRCPGLRWEFYTWGKKNAFYQRHVIMGFTQVLSPKYGIDIDAMVAAYAHCIVASRGSVPHYGLITIRGVEIDLDAVTARMRPAKVERDAFLRWVKLAESQA